MPKMKTNKSLSKRVKITGTGKVMRRRPGKGHLKSRKSPARLRKLREEVQLPDAFARHAKMMLGVG